MANVEQQFGIQIWPVWLENARAFNVMHDPNIAEYINGIVDKVIRPTDQNESKYVADVRTNLHRILQSRAGLALAHSLRFMSRGKTIVIRPIEFDECVAEEIPLAKSGSQVGFSPSTLARTCNFSAPNALPHEKLYHELVHALRRVGGHIHQEQMTGWRNSEEFIAVVVTDIFISDPPNHNKTSLRGNYPGRDPLDPLFADSFSFFRLGLQTFKIVERFCRENHGFSQLLAKLRAPFNPVAAYYQNRSRAFNIAVNGSADNWLENLGDPMDFYLGPKGTFVKTNPVRGLPPARR